MKIGILTDSTADLTQEIINKYNINVVPLSVQFENKTYRDGIELSNEQFFNKIKKTDKLPKTSQPSTASLINKFKEMSKKYDAIISLHLSAGLSGTFEAVKNISHQLTDIDIYPLDSASISLGLGFQTLLAAKLSRKYDSIDKIIEIIEKAKQNLFVYFTISDFTYMEKGGRIGKAKAFLGNILNINPIISLSTSTGQVQPLYKTRGKKRTINKMVNIAMEKLKGKNYAWIGFVHGDRKKDMIEFKNLLLDRVKEKLNNKLKTKIFQKGINSTLACHVGPSVYAGVIISGDFLNI